MSTSSNNEPARLVPPPVMAELLGVTVQRLNHMRYERTGPPYVRVGRSIRYDPDQAMVWVRENTVTPSESA